MKRSFYIFAIIIALISFSPVHAQEQGLLLKLNRDFGFGDFSGNIQGRFSLVAEGPEDLKKVIFYFDDQLMNEDIDPPFKLQFSTSDYSLGVHSFRAVGYTDSGEELTSNEIRRNLISANEGWRSAQQIILPLVGFILAILILTFTVPAVLTRGKLEHLPLGAQRQYGFFGGAVCPKCSRPFSMHIYGLNMGLSKFDRCPYCGRWSLVHRTPINILRAAEQAELVVAGSDMSPDGLSPEDELRKELEDSRFQDM